jgi:hypothetical protein
LALLNRLSVGSAFVSCAGRMVGASYRVWDAYNPKLRQQGITPVPELVVRRESISLGLSWVFGLFTSILAGEMERAFKIPAKVGMFLNVVFANVLAEGISRLATYRKAIPTVRPRERLFVKKQLMSIQPTFFNATGVGLYQNKMIGQMPPGFRPGLRQRKLYPKGRQFMTPGYRGIRKHSMMAHSK